MIDLTDRPRLDRYKVHDIELAEGRLKSIRAGDKERPEGCAATAMKFGKGSLIILDLKEERSST